MEKQKNGAAGAESYLCGQCFTWHRQNDVLFDANRSCRGCDVRQAAHRYAFADPQAYRQWCAAGMRRVLLDWQDFPPHRRRQSQGVLTALQDAGGKWCRGRVCPSCHSALVDVQGQLLAGWSRQGLDLGRARKLLQGASAGVGGWKEQDPKTRQADGALEYARFFHSGRQISLALPMGLERAAGSYARGCRSRFGEAASCAALWLDLTGIAQLRPGELLLDGAARDTLADFLHFVGYVGVRLPLPVVVLIEGAAPGADIRQTLEEHAPQLLLRLHTCLENTLLLEWNESGSTARQAGDWLAETLCPPEQPQPGRTEETRR